MYAADHPGEVAELVAASAALAFDSAVPVAVLLSQRLIFPVVVDMPGDMPLGPQALSTDRRQPVPEPRPGCLRACLCQPAQWMGGSGACQERRLYRRPGGGLLRDYGFWRPKPKGMRSRTYNASAQC
jgi:hypothetical protein